MNPIEYLCYQANMKPTLIGVGDFMAPCEIPSIQRHFRRLILTETNDDNYIWS